MVVLVGSDPWRREPEALVNPDVNTREPRQRLTASNAKRKMGGLPMTEPGGSVPLVGRAGISYLVVDVATAIMF